MQQLPDRGAEMLDALDAKLAAGELTQSQYDAQRVRVLELIRTGRADVSGVRRAIAIVCSIILILFGVGFGLALGTAFAWVIGLAMIIAGVLGLRRSV